MESQSKDELMTRQQQKSLHLWFKLLADVLNQEGMTMDIILKKFVIDVPATKLIVKEMLWKPLQSAMYGKESTTELLKIEEIDKIYDALCKFLGQELGITTPPFPSLDEKNFKETYK